VGDVGRREVRLAEVSSPCPLAKPLPLCPNVTSYKTKMAPGLDPTVFALGSLLSRGRGGGTDGSLASVDECARRPVGRRAAVPSGGRDRVLGLRHPRGRPGPEGEDRERMGSFVRVAPPDFEVFLNTFPFTP